MSRQSCGTATRPPAVFSPIRKRARHWPRGGGGGGGGRGRTNDALNAELVIVGVDEALAQHAGEIADERALRGYDAVHLASALALGSGETILVTWDLDLSNAAVDAGLAVAPAL